MEDLYNKYKEYIKKYYKSETEYCVRFVEEQLEYDPTAKLEVLWFIAGFMYKNIPYTDTETSSECIRYTFRAGYCYYFAHMLKTAFNRGQVCWCAPIGHIVWVDDDGMPYDIEGVNHSDCEYYIPEEFMKHHVDDFKHIVSGTDGATGTEVLEIICEYEKYLVSIGEKPNEFKTKEN